MDDLISEFITETSESLAVLDLELVKLEQNPEDAAILGNIFRMVHTIKGTCGFLGLPRLERVAHAGENVLGKIRDKVLAATPEAVTLILESLDCIKGLLEHLSAHGEEQAGDDSDLIARLNHYADTGTLMGGAPAAAAPAACDQWRRSRSRCCTRRTRSRISAAMMNWKSPLPWAMEAAMAKPS